jgi:Gluconate 2-dehydrogenase subunit 3
MKRRHALKSLIALVALPAWANAWTAHTLPSTASLNTDQQQTLIEITATLIPEGEIPGAKSLGVATFVQRMVADCYEKNVQTDFELGLNSLENVSKNTYNQSFVNVTFVQKNALLQQIKTEQPAFYTLVRSLTIQGYTSSEYVMTKHLKYVMAPGYYHGCAKI